MKKEDGHISVSPFEVMPDNSPSATSLPGRSSHTSVTRQSARLRSLLDLNDDVFNYLCAFVPLNDLLCNLAAANRETWRRVLVNHALWQQLWIRYLLQFSNSLIPQTKETPPVGTRSSPTLRAVRQPNTPSAPRTSAATMPRHSSAWYLFHFHHSAERKPRVVRLEELCLVREDITNPRTATPSLSGRSPVELRAKESRAQVLRFAQECATQTVANNLTHMTAPLFPLSASLPLSDPQDGAPQGVNLAQLRTCRARKQQQRQAHRLQRVLHFLLSESGHRPRFHDRLWGATNEAKMEFIRRRCTADTPTASDDRSAQPLHSAKSATRQNPTTSPPSRGLIAPPKPPARLRPMSWLDDEETSVKVLLFNDDTRSVGGAETVKEERSKLLASITNNWRIAYSSNFYPCGTDGNDPVSFLPHPASSLFPGSTTAASAAAVVGSGGTAAHALGAERGGSHHHHHHHQHQHQQPTLSRGQNSWEQVYRRFRDDNRAVTRSNARVQQQEATLMVESTSVDSAVVVPSSNNPLFDLHLLGYEKRKQIYNSMLASTVEAPDGMGVFFGTCVSESFLQWLCWWNGQRREAKQASRALPREAVSDDRVGLPMKHHIALTPFTTAFDAVSPPRSLWVVQVIPKDPRDHVNNDHEDDQYSVTYSSSYSDVTTSTTMSDSISGSSRRLSDSIDFTEEDEIRSATAENAGAQETDHPVASSEDAHVTTPGVSHSLPPQSAPPQHVPVGMLFPLPHMLAYWFMMHHVSFYSHQVYRRAWGDQELTVAVCSRIISPTGHSAECRLFYSLRCATSPRMFTKMMFTPGSLPSLTLPVKIEEHSPYRSPSTLSHDSQSSAGGHSRSSSPFESIDGKPVDSRQIYDLFWVGFGRVEVECGPTISRSNMVRLRITLGLPEDFPMGLLWNVVMFASGMGPLILKEHRHSLHFSYIKTFTDVVEDEFGAFACYGFGAQSPNLASNTTATANPIDVPPLGVQSLVSQTGNGGDRITRETEQQARSRLGPVDEGSTGTSTPITSTTQGPWNLDSELSSLEGYRSPPFSDISSR